MATAMQWIDADHLAALYGDSYFIFDEDRFRSTFIALHSAFAAEYPKCLIGYSYKTNYTPYVCAVAHELGGLAEIVSDMEHWLATQLGVPNDRIVYNGPCKGESSTRAILSGGGVVNVDNSRDLDMVTRLASECTDAPGRIGIRCNFPLHEGTRSRFGFDIDALDFADALRVARGTRGLELCGFHCHFPDRDLGSFRRRIDAMLDLTSREFPSAPPQFVNVGGGFMGDIDESLAVRLGVRRVTFAEYAFEIAGKMRERFGTGTDAPVLILEPGTALVASAFRFVTRVAHVKQVGERRVATVSGSLLNFSASARRNDLPCAVLSRSEPSGLGQASRLADVGGFTCIEGDLLAVGKSDPIEPGDFLAFDNVGSYSVVMKPPFILPAPAILRKRHGPSGQSVYDVIRSPETYEHVFDGYVMPRVHGGMRA